MVIKGYRERSPRPPKSVIELKRLIDEWREKDTVTVNSSNIVPSGSNRDDTGLSLDHVHFIATQILLNGFRGRLGLNLNVRERKRRRVHDIPVLCRGTAECPIASESLEIWRAIVRRERRFPPIVVNEQAFFTSLGNGHFSQALNLFRHMHPSKFTGIPFSIPAADVALKHAVVNGVESIILRTETPVNVRRRIAKLLNAAHDYKWTLNAGGEMDISISQCYYERFNQFEAQAKVSDSEALGALVQLELGIFNEDDDEEPLRGKL